jgi:glycosyltransferase involved in cell wall biosynthesis
MYQEANALPGWLEAHLPYFDDIRVLHAGPQGEYSNDGTIELLQKWNIPVEYCAIDEGFGVVRTRALRMCPCDWVMLLDADERFYHTSRILGCSGQPTPHSEVDDILRRYDFRGSNMPDWDAISKLGSQLHIHDEGVHDQGTALRRIIDGGQCDAIITVRRHWHDFTFRRPTQNWYTDPDWQMRTVRKCDAIHFDTSTRMHERLVGASSAHRAWPRMGPFMDHFHFTYKRMEQEQRRHDIAIYDSVHAGSKPPTRDEFARDIDG